MRKYLISPILDGVQFRFVALLFPIPLYVSAGIVFFGLTFYVMAPESKFWQTSRGLSCHNHLIMVQKEFTVFQADFCHFSVRIEWSGADEVSSHSWQLITAICDEGQGLKLYD
jgi:hypothetical protein